MAIIMVTHDLGVIASMCDEIIVMYGGRVCERGTADAIFYSPAHEYTKGLLRSIPTKTNSKTRLVPIGGTPINMLNMPKGCAFCPRCDAAMKICLTEKPEEIPEGCTVMELPAGKMLCGYVRGIDASYVVAQAHDLVMARADRSGYEFDMDRLMLMEGYNNPRFTKPDEQGRIIFDYYIPVVKKTKKK